MIKVDVFIVEAHGSGNVEKTREWKMQVLEMYCHFAGSYYGTFYELPFGIEVFGSAKNAGYTRIGDEV
jgi:hypothetical protein